MRPVAHDGSIASSRPRRKAAVFTSTATPLSSMARSMLDADWGRRPCWYATPTTTRFAAGCDPNASSATASASRYTCARVRSSSRRPQGGDVGEVLAGDIGDHGAGRDLRGRHDRGGPVGIEAGHVGGRDAGEQVEHEEGVGPALLEPGGALGRAGADAQVRHDRSALLGHAGLVDARHLQPVEVGGGGEHLADGDDAGAADAGDEECRAVGARSAPAATAPSARGPSACRPQLAAWRDGHERGAVALDAAHVEVARVLVDARLAAERSLDRVHAQAVRDVAAVAAALADGLVDHHARRAVSVRGPRLRSRRSSAAHAWS